MLQYQVSFTWLYWPPLPLWCQGGNWECNHHPYINITATTATFLKIFGSTKWLNDIIQ